MKLQPHEGTVKPPKATLHGEIHLENMYNDTRNVALEALLLTPDQNFRLNFRPHFTNSASSNASLLTIYAPTPFRPQISKRILQNEQKTCQPSARNRGALTSSTLSKSRLRTIPRARPSPRLRTTNLRADTCCEAFSRRTPQKAQYR
jgi:hypothetical protein